MFDSQGDLRQRTFEFARQIAQTYRSLPWRDRVAQTWGEQMLRSGASIGANYREAQRGRSLAEYRAKLGDSLREADETLYWIELLSTERYLTQEQTTPLQKEANELIAIFVTLIRKKGLKAED